MCNFLVDISTSILNMIMNLGKSNNWMQNTLRMTNTYLKKKKKKKKWNILIKSVLYFEGLKVYKNIIYTFIKGDDRMNWNQIGDDVISLQFKY